MTDWSGGFDYSTAGDQADTAAKPKVGPKPVGQGRDAISDAQHEGDVHDSPQPPCRCARQLQDAEIRHGGLAADGGKRAQVAITKWRQWPPRFNHGPNLLGHVRSALLGRRSQPRHDFTFPSLARRRVTDREYVGEPRYPQVIAHDEASRLIRGRIQPRRRRRCGHSGSPKDCTRFDASSVNGNSRFIDMINPATEMNFHSQL